MYNSSTKEKALKLLKTNNLQHARILLNQVTQTNPDDAQAWGVLGALNETLGNLVEAEKCFRQVITLDPRNVEAYYHMGHTLCIQGRPKEAVTFYSKCIELNSHRHDMYLCLGNAYKAAGQLTEAEEAYRAAVKCKGDYAEAFNNLGNILREQKKLDEAIDAFTQAIRNQPEYAEAYSNLGLVQRDLGLLNEALESCLAAVRIKPNYAHAYNRLGNVLCDLGRLDEAITSYRHALRIKQDMAEAHVNLGLAMARKGRLSSALVYYRQGLSGTPNDSQVYNRIGNALVEQGNVDKAYDAYRHALDINPRNFTAHSNLLLTLNYSSAINTKKLLAEHRHYATRINTPKKICQPRPVSNQRQRLRIGYVSPDFCRHSVAFFIEAILTHHDRASIETYCYAEVASPDETTKRLMEKAGCWRRTCGLTDAQVADTIRADAIDILVDLAGHTADNRLPVFAYKPAPVQVTYLGYPNTTGLSTIDYRLTDSLADPPGQEAFHTEELIRLPQGFLCYTPPAEAPPVGPLPAENNKYVTFGSFNALPKINTDVVARWAQLLKVVQNSRLILKNRSLRDEDIRKHYSSLFQEHGIGPERLELIGWLPRTSDHLALYNRADIALDTFPYNGTTTTCEALWMGVPAITLAGDRHAGRVGTSLLTQVGLPEMIANTAEEYVKIAVELAADLDRLAALRSGLRERVANSPLCDGITFTRRLEQAYRGMWERWRANEKIKP